VTITLVVRTLENKRNRNCSLTGSIITIVFKSFPVVVLATIAITTQLKAAEPELRFETAVVKPWVPSPNPLLGSPGCYVGPGMLLYNCRGTVPALVAEALNLDDFQFKAAGPGYTITAKLSKPATRQQMDDMLGRFLQEQMGVRYHFEKRPIKAEFLIVTSPDLLVNLPISNDPIPVAAEYDHPVIRGFHGPVPRFVHFAEVPEAYRSSNSPLWVEGETRIACRNITFRLFAQLLYVQYKLPVIDETGVAQRFNLDLSVRRGEGGSGGTNLSDIRKILAKYGISLQPRQGVMDFMVLDQVADEAKFLN
jgi:uncharacterized protein (TIGR03435 family)